MTIRTKKFTTLREDEAADPVAVAHWSRKLTEELNELHKILHLVDVDLTGKAGHTVRVNATETGFEITP